MTNQFILEVCANSVESALAAQRGGAHRVELCDNLYEGGTTPSAGSIELARAGLAIDLHVLIRPRGGDFCYSSIEFDIMRRDIALAKNLGADGVVIGALLPDGHVDVQRCRELVGIARPLSVTFHRAFDMTPDPMRALEDIVSLGVQRILTSGQKNKAVEGAGLIARLVERAAGRVSILVGSGVNEQNICALIRETGAQEFHVSGRKSFPSRMLYRNESVRMGGLQGIPEYEISLTDEETICRIIQVANTSD